MISLSAVVRLCITLGTSLTLTGVAEARDIACDLGAFRQAEGLDAKATGDGVEIVWTGDGGRKVRMALAIQGGAPTIRSLALEKVAGEWVSLLQDARPEFAITTGVRRISNQQLRPLRELGIPLTQATVDKYRWDPFWDAPLDVGPPVGRESPGGNPPPAAGLPDVGQPGLPRQSSEIERAVVAYHITGCTVASEGARITVTFPGVTLGAFDGRMQYTIFRGTNLIRQELIATTTRPWVAYKFSAGIGNIAPDTKTRIIWRDIARQWQENRLGGAPNAGQVPLAAANRLIAMERGDAALAFFPEPHRFFWAREVAINMGYDWYRKDADGRFALGVRQNDKEDLSEDPANWALYSARPGTEQRMPVYLYPHAGDGAASIEQALDFTHRDTYKPLPGYQVMNHHYHMDMGQRLIEAGSLDVKLPDLQVLKSLGINIVSQIDSIIFRKAGEAPPPVRGGRGGGPQARVGTDQLAITRAAVEGARIHSDGNFLIMPDQEVFESPLGGHTDLLFGHPVYWDMRKLGQPFEEQDPAYGKVYHIGGADDLMKMARQENIMISMPHPRTKGSTGFPDAVHTQPDFLDSHYDGVGMRWGMGLDGSERRLCEYRCWPLLDDLSNWMADQPGPLKHILAISEVRHMQPGDDVYSSQPVSYVRLDSLPPADDPAPVIKALQAGDSFWTSGEVLATGFKVSGAGRASVVEADVEWTLPLEFVELVWGDGKSTFRKIVRTPEETAYGRRHFAIPVDLSRAKWVRFAAWDNAADGAVLQPVRVGKK